MRVKDDDGRLVGNGEIRRESTVNCKTCGAGPMTPDQLSDHDWMHYDSGEAEREGRVHHTTAHLQDAGEFKNAQEVDDFVRGAFAATRCDHSTCDCPYHVRLHPDERCTCHEPEVRDAVQ